MIEKIRWKCRIYFSGQDKTGDIMDYKKGVSDRHHLELMPAHALYQLWSIRNEQAGWMPAPVLCLEGKKEPPMSDEDAKKELSRLLVRVNISANGRLEKLRPKKREGDSGESAVPDLDAEVMVFTSKDEQRAWVLVYPPSGAGRELDDEILSAELEREQICFGIDRDLADGLPGVQDRYFRLIPIARGREAVHGLDGSVEDRFPRKRERKPAVDEHNRVDYMNLNFIHNVKAGEIICRITPPTEGEPGRTVRNREIAARNGKPAVVPKGRNTVLSEDGLTLMAAISGNVEFSGRSFQVSQVMEIPGNVDYSVGNINFLGDVHIHGDICRGFTVRAMGNITVDGVVEACSVEAGRDLIVVKGIQGDNQAVIRAQRSIYAKFLENCCVSAKVSLEADCIIGCEVYCDGTVTVRSGHKSIIGGEIYAAHEVSAGTIGTRMENRTDIIIGGQPCENFDYDMLRREIWEMEEELNRVDLQPDAPLKIAQMGKLRAKLSVGKGRLDMLKKEMELQGQEQEDPGVRRLICDTVYPGTRLKIDKTTYEFKTRTAYCQAELKDGEICFGF